jgi:hypothetical protein
MADNGRKSKLIPMLAVGAVILLGSVGLVRGCSYAAEPTPAETGGEPVREAPDV